MYHIQKVKFIDAHAPMWLYPDKPEEISFRANNFKSAYGKFQRTVKRSDAPHILTNDFHMLAYYIPNGRRRFHIERYTLDNPAIGMGHRG